MGALNSKVHLDKVVYYAKLATEEGGTIQCGYGLNSMDLDDKIKDGYYFPPTVVTGLTNDSRCMKEEIFGPIGNFTLLFECIKFKINYFLQSALILLKLRKKPLTKPMMWSMDYVLQSGQKMLELFIEWLVNWRLELSGKIAG